MAQVNSHGTLLTKMTLIFTPLTVLTIVGEICNVCNLARCASALKDLIVVVNKTLFLRQ